MTGTAISRDPDPDDDHDDHVDRDGAVGRQPRRLDVVFGLTALVAFGSWFYGFGVLVDPLAADGIGESFTAPTYGAGLLLGGVGSLLAGRALDRSGGRRLFALGAPVVLVGTGAVVMFAEAGRPLAFAVTAAVTAGTVGALGHYSLIHATIVALHPDDRTRAITVNTLWGAFASPVFLPAMGAVTDRWSWQVALVGANVLVVLAFIAMALVLPGGPDPVSAREASTVAVADDPARRPDEGTRTTPEPAEPTTSAPQSILRRLPALLTVAAAGGAATSVLLLYQVPAMVDAGLALTVASTLAGVRGAMQVAGRLPLPPLVRRLGTGPVMAGSLLLLAVAALLLVDTATLAVAIAFVVVGGLAVGAMTTVENLFATDLLATTTVGAALGAVAVARGVGGAVGPSLAGLVTAWHGTRTPALVGVAVLSLATVVLVLLVVRRHPTTRTTT